MILPSCDIRLNYTLSVFSGNLSGGGRHIPSHLPHTATEFSDDVLGHNDESDPVSTFRVQPQCVKGATGPSIH